MVRIEGIKSWIIKCSLSVILVVFSGVNKAEAQFFWWIDKGKICKNACNLTLRNMEDKQVFLKDYLLQGPLLLVFWTTWCPYCRDGIKELVEEISKLRNKPECKIFLINIGESKEKVRRFLSQFGGLPSVEVLFDKNKLMTKDCRVIGLPTYIVINKKGEVEFFDYYLPKNYLSP